MRVIGSMKLPSIVLLMRLFVSQHPLTMVQKEALILVVLGSLLALITPSQPLQFFSRYVKFSFLLSPYVINILLYLLAPAIKNVVAYKTQKQAGL